MIGPWALAGPAGGPIAGVAHLLAQPDLRRAVLAGGAIAAASGLVSFFVVLRSQTFAGDALSHVAFTGSAAALALGVDPRIGLFAGCVAVGLAMAGLDRAGRPDDVLIGTVFAWVLGLGAFFLTLYTTARSTGNGAAGAGVLFGSLIGIGTGAAQLAGALAAAVAAVMLVLARPLLFASLDPDVARARGVPVRALGLAFLAVVGVTAGEARQAVGSLLVLALLAAPGGTALRLTTRPWRGLGLSVAAAVLAVWGGLGLAYAFPRLPASVPIVALAVGSYLLAAFLPPRAAPRRHAAQVPTISST